MTTKTGKEFKKGQTVIYFASWDRKGTWYFKRALVKSCGAQQMTLLELSTEKMMGCNFRPNSMSVREYVYQGVAGVSHYSDCTKADMTDEEAHALCLEFAAAELVRERAHIERCIAQSETAGYTKAMEKKLAELHEPRSMQR